MKTKEKRLLGICERTEFFRDRKKIIAKKYIGSVEKGRGRELGEGVNFLMKLMGYFSVQMKNFHSPSPLPTPDEFFKIFHQFFLIFLYVTLGFFIIFFLLFIIRRISMFRCKIVGGRGKVWKENLSCTISIKNPIMIFPPSCVFLLQLAKQIAEKNGNMNVRVSRKRWWDSTIIFGSICSCMKIAVGEKQHEKSNYRNAFSTDFG